MTDHDPMDTRLRAYADRWRESAPPAPAVDTARLASRRSGRAWWVAGLSAAAIAIAILSGTLLAGHDPSAPPKPLHTATPSDGVVPWAALPPTHPQIVTETSSASPDPAEAAAQPECRASDLHATSTLGAAAGTEYLVVRLSLAGPHPCRLEGYPDLRLMDQGRQVDIPTRQQTDDSIYRDPVLVAAGGPAILRLGWGSAWCTNPVHNDTIEILLSGGAVSFAGFGGSPYCNGGTGTTPITVETFAPAKRTEPEAATVYADVEVTGALDITATPDTDVDFVVTLTSPHDLVLDPCPDFQIIQSGHDEPVTESYALNCAAVPFKDDEGRPYLPAGRPVQFAMQTTAGDPGLYKLSWVLDTVDVRGTSGTLTVAPATPAAPSAEPTAADAVQRKAAVHAGVPVLQGFLDTYRRDGIVAAARKYLPADSQPDSAVGVPRLASGSVVNAEVSSWESPDHFTLEVGLDLHFDGDPGAWNEGRNDRFVTFTRSGGALRIEEIASSP